MQNLKNLLLSAVPDIVLLLMLAILLSLRAGK
jgi:hypothetical protein